MEIESLLPDIVQEIKQFHHQNPQGVIIIRWATATGKSKCSVLLSDFFDIEIISADSRQIYKHMDIGTDKVSQEIRNRIPHHQIDIVDPTEKYTASQWHQDTRRIIGEIHTRGKIPLIVGGTGLYIDSIYKNFSMPEVIPDFELRDQLYAEEKNHPGILHQKLTAVDPDEASKIHPHCDRHLVRALEIYYKTWIPKSQAVTQLPVERPLLMIGLRREKDDSNRRINARIKEMLKTWLIEEVQWLLDTGIEPHCQSMEGIGYKETIKYLQGEYNLEKLEEYLKRDTHHFAKKQRTRFKRYIAEWIAQPKENVTYKIFKLKDEKAFDFSL